MARGRYGFDDVHLLLPVVQRNRLELVLVVHVQAAEGKPSLRELVSRQAELLGLQGIEVLSKCCSEPGCTVMILDGCQMLLGGGWILQSLRYEGIVLMRSQMKRLSVDPNAVGCSHTPHDIL